ncbi:hypothetical protein VULLAG_LOCUS15960 [Vulpes lagopus]
MALQREGLASSKVKRPRSCRRGVSAVHSRPPPPPKVSQTHLERASHCPGITARPAPRSGNGGAASQWPPAPGSRRPSPRSLVCPAAGLVHLPPPRPGCALCLLAACGRRQKGGGIVRDAGDPPYRPRPRPRPRPHQTGCGSRGERTRRRARLVAERGGRSARARGLRTRRGPGQARAAEARLRPPPPRAPAGGADPGGSGREAPAAEGGARRGWAARRRSPSVAAPIVCPRRGWAGLSRFGGPGRVGRARTPRGPPPS